MLINLRRTGKLLIGTIVCVGCGERVGGNDGEIERGGVAVVKLRSPFISEDCYG